MPCCRRRGVSPSCSSLCQAVTHRPDQVSACDQDLDNIFTCYEEGAANLPPPVLQVEAARVEDNGVLLKWRIGDNLTNDEVESSISEIISTLTKSCRPALVQMRLSQEVTIKGSA